MDTIFLSYSAFKEIVLAKDLKWQYSEEDACYRIWAFDVQCRYGCSIYKSNPGLVGGFNWAAEEANLNDFLANYKPTANNKLENPTVPDNVFSMQTQKVFWEFAKNATSEQLFQLANLDGESYVYKYLSGADWKVYDAVEGDWVKFQVVDHDNILGYGADFVLKEYVVGKYIWNETPMECVSMAPGRLPVGLYLRCIYVSVGTENNPRMYVNFHVEVKD